MAEEKAKKTSTKPTKTINIKNKKAAKQTLAKASIKGKKTTIKASTVKKKPKTVEKKVALLDDKELLVENKEAVKTEKKAKTTKQTKKTPTKKSRVVKAPNNIKRKIKPEEKEINIKEQTIESTEKKTDVIDELLSKESTTLPNNIVKVDKEEKHPIKVNKKLEKLKAREEKRRQKKEKKLKAKEEKIRLKDKKRKEKQTQKELKKKKVKIELPKEWKTINTKNNKAEKSKDETPKSFKGKIRSSIFESIDEKELEERKKKDRESIKKTIIIILILGVIITVIIYSLLKYNDFVRKKLAVYESFRIGDVVKLNDDSKWYVITDSDSSEDTIKVLAGHLVDIDNNGVLDATDLVSYNSTGKAEYDSNVEYSVANLLGDAYKKRYELGIGTIEEMSILTSKEYVKIRERMNFGDEWDQGNWLANSSFQKWWILSEQNDRVFVATPRGTFILTSPTKSYYIRPTIVIKKDLVTKLEEKKEITMDLINGLKRKQG